MTIPKIPINPGQQAHQAALAVSAGAGAIHVHPCDSRGRESISPEDVGAALDAIRGSCPTVPIRASVWRNRFPSDQRFDDEGGEVLG